MGTLCCAPCAAGVAHDANSMSTAAMQPAPVVCPCAYKWPGQLAVACSYTCVAYRTDGCIAVGAGPALVKSPAPAAGSGLVSLVTEQCWVCSCATHLER
jgi:hypothetical protein